MKMTDRIVSKFAKLSDEQKDEATKKVMENLKNKTDEEESDEKKDEESDKSDDKSDEKKDDKSDEKKDDKSDEKKDDKSEMSDEEEVEEESDESLDLMDEIQTLSDEITAIKEDGKVDSSEVIGLFQTMMDMTSELLRAKPGRKPRKKKANVGYIADRVACTYLLYAARGLQVKRKDKDLMSDTGGTSKKREREPDQKPPRYDMKKPFRTKDKRAPERDKDTDNDKDMKKSSVLLRRIR